MSKEIKVKPDGTVVLTICTEENDDWIRQKKGVRESEKKLHDQLSKDHEKKN